MDLLVIEEIGGEIFLTNFWVVIDFLVNSVSSNLLFETVPEKETNNSLSIFELLLQSLNVLISTFLIKYSDSVISNLLVPSPAMYVTLSPVISPWLGIVISVLSSKEPENERSDSLISKASLK